MYHRQVVSFDSYLPYFQIKTQEIYIFPWLVSMFLHAVIPSIIFVNNKIFPFQFWWSITFHRFFDSFRISRPACIIGILLLYAKTTISLWRDTFRVWMIFLNVTLKAVFIHIYFVHGGFVPSLKWYIEWPFIRFTLIGKAILLNHFVTLLTDKYNIWCEASMVRSSG